MFWKIAVLIYFPIHNEQNSCYEIILHFGFFQYTYVLLSLVALSTPYIGRLCMSYLAADIVFL